MTPRQLILALLCQFGFHHYRNDIHRTGDRCLRCRHTFTPNKLKR